MAFKAADRVKETTTTIGTSDLTLLGAAGQCQTFSTGIGNGNTCHYLLLDADGTNWEIGVGAVSAGALARTTILESTNSGSKISLSTGTHTVLNTALAGHLLTYPAELDNALGSTRGSVAYRGASGWTALTPGTSGDVLTTAGSGADPSWTTPSGGGGGGGGDVVLQSGGVYGSLAAITPTQANTGFTTWLNQGTATAVDTPAGISINSPSAGGDNIIGLLRAAPATPYHLRFLVAMSGPLTNFRIAGVGWQDPVSGKILGLEVGNIGVRYMRYNNPNSSGGPITTDGLVNNPTWLHLLNDGTNYSIGLSYDGEHPYFYDSNVYSSSFLGSGAAFANIIFYTNMIGGAATGTMLAAPDLISSSTTVPVNLENLADVTVSSPIIGQSLIWNGVAWVNGLAATMASTGLMTWGNQGSATVADTPKGILLSAPNNGNAENLRIIYKAAPTAPYTITALLAVTSSFVYTEHAVAALGFFDGTSASEGIGIHIGASSGANGALTLTKNSSFTSAANIDIGNPYPNPLWIQIQDDGSAVHYKVGVDGYTFHSIKDELKSGGYLTSYSNVFFGVDAYGSATSATLMSYTESFP